MSQIQDDTESVGESFTADILDEELESDEDNDMDYQEVRNKRRRHSVGSDSSGPQTKKPVQRKTKLPKPVTTKNSYQVLASQALTSSDSPAGAADQSPLTKRHRIPPVIVQNLGTHKELVNLLMSTGLDAASFSIKPRLTVSRITIRDIASYRAITTKLDEASIEYYTFPTERTKSQRFVIRGLPSSALPADIKDELTEMGFNVRSVRQLAAPGDSARLLPLFECILHGTHGQPPTDLTQLKRLQCCVVTTEAPRGKKVAVTQCFHCQRVGHTAPFCHQAPRCVRCGSNHEVQNCTVNRADRELVKCCNCGEAHAACYRGCATIKAATRHAARARRPAATADHAHPSRRSEPQSERPTALPRASLQPAASPRTSPPRDSQPISYAAAASNIRQESQPLSDHTTPATNIDWFAVITSLAQLVAEMDIHPIVTTLARLVPTLLKSVSTRNADN